MLMKLSPVVSMSEPRATNEEERTDGQTEVHQIQVTDKSSVKENELREMFDAIDIDKDGRLSVEELIKWHHSVGLNPTQEEVQTLLAECDADGSTYIEFDEYKDKLKTRMDAAVNERDALMDAFRTLDKKGDGTVSYRTLRTVLSGTGDVLEEELQDEIFQDMDVKKDGIIIYKDMVGKLCRT
ncbi:calmodulin-A-like [Ylistrum balloti]|uniref:calmodulin-A-like n=1 Tax=Ylistrum balloti TaxID=509963 RepID=UPI002905C581|nr:calmodulin-A-like [Ylistrum balloti]